MEGFFLSFAPFIKKAGKYWIEIILIFLSFIIACFSFYLFTNESIKNNAEPEIQEKITENNLLVEISGSVQNPGVYSLAPDSRIKDIIKKSGGLTTDADKDFINRNFNFARKLQDQEKIYIPSLSEIQNGVFFDEKRSLNYLQPGTLSTSLNNETAEEKININTGSIDDIDTLPGVGKVTAQKIIDNRPYGALQNLKDKKVISSKIFENIINLITY